jgi:hypothetical protein
MAVAKGSGGKKDTGAISIPAMNLDHLTMTVVGDTSLIVHKWSEKAKKQMLDKMTKKATGPRAAKDPEQEFKDSIYRLADGRPGFPSIGLKSAAVDAASFISDVTKVVIRGAFHIDDELVAIEGDDPVLREDVVTVGMGGTDLRYRGEFKKWRMTFTVRFNASILSEEQIINLFQQAGFSIGLGEWRAQKNGRNGLFHVAGREDLQQAA